MSANKCSLLIHRAFGSDFLVYFPNVQAAWESMINILRQIELIEGDEPMVATKWDVKGGFYTSSVLLSDYKEGPQEHLKSLLSNTAKNLEYMVASGNSYQLILIKGQSICTTHERVILMTNMQAIYYLNNSDDVINFKPTTLAHIMKVV